MRFEWRPKRLRISSAALVQMNHTVQSQERVEKILEVTKGWTIMGTSSFQGTAQFAHGHGYRFPPTAVGFKVVPSARLSRNLTIPPSDWCPDSSP